MTCTENFQEAVTRSSRPIADGDFRESSFLFAAAAEEPSVNVVLDHSIFSPTVFSEPLDSEEVAKNVYHYFDYQYQSSKWKRTTISLNENNNKNELGDDHNYCLGKSENDMHAEVEFSSSEGGEIVEILNLDEIQISDERISEKSEHINNVNESEGSSSNFHEDDNEEKKEHNEAVFVPSGWMPFQYIEKLISILQLLLYKKYLFSFQFPSKN